jgi:3-methylcrotonyl-CoA carboxylase alpha subunit
MRHRLLLDDVPHDVWLARAGSRDVLLMDGERHELAAPPAESVVVVDGDIAHIHHRGRAYVVRYVDALDHLAEAGGSAAEDVARAPMPGSVIAVHVAPGSEVKAGDTMMVIESMKMETAIRAARDGVVEQAHFVVGATFDRDAVLVTLAPMEG